jgi:hypothetical protein
MYGLLFCTTYFLNPVVFNGSTSLEQAFIHMTAVALGLRVAVSAMERNCLDYPSRTKEFELELEEARCFGCR